MMTSWQMRVSSNFFEAAPAVVPEHFWLNDCSDRAFPTLPTAHSFANRLIMPSGGGGGGGGLESRKMTCSP